VDEYCKVLIIAVLNIVIIIIGWTRCHSPEEQRRAATREETTCHGCHAPAVHAEGEEGRVEGHIGSIEAHGRVYCGVGPDASVPGNYNWFWFWFEYEYK
jgi:hypothetical protein